MGLAQINLTLYAFQINFCRINRDIYKYNSDIYVYHMVTMWYSAHDEKYMYIYTAGNQMIKMMKILQPHAALPRQLIPLRHLRS